jgi:hypothetical protein
MYIDPSKSKKILVVHGISPSTDADIIHNQRLESNMRSRLTAPVDFTVDMFKYESMNDDSQRAIKLINKVFTKCLITEKVIEYTIDLLGDVVTYIIESSTAREITDRLKQTILDNVQNHHNPLTIVAHSLGSLYAFNAIMELIAEHPTLFNMNDRTTWPIQSFVTLGSPIGLSFLQHKKLTSMETGANSIRWYNYYDVLDPVVSGNIFGNPTEKLEIASKLHTTGWDITDIIIDNGSSWIAAHTGYWENQSLADDLISIITT